MANIEQKARVEELHGKEKLPIYLIGAPPKTEAQPEAHVALVAQEAREAHEAPVAQE